MIKKIDVLANKTLVGTLALTKDHRIAFQYSYEWVQNGFSLNPFKLPYLDSCLCRPPLILEAYLGCLRSPSLTFMVNCF